MKTFTLFFALILSIGIVQGQDNGNTITVTVNNVTSNEGTVAFSLHTEATFMKAQGIQSVASLIENGIAKATFKNVKPGTYAVMVLHDANNNKRMDYEVNGMPKESYGTSNNPMSYGPPQFMDSKFEVTNTDLDLIIRF